MLYKAKNVCYNFPSCELSQHLPPYPMKAIALILFTLATSSFAYSGIAWTKHYTIRTATKVCAVDIVKLDTGRIIGERSCFLIK